MKTSIKNRSDLLLSVVLFLLANINQCLAVDLTASISFLDQTSSANPTSLTYYWSSTQTPNQARTLNLAVSLQIGQSISTVQLTTAAQILVKCSQSPTSNTNFAQLSFTDTTVSLSSSSNIAVQFTIQSSGQPPLISCTGTVASFTSQTVNNQQLTNLVIVNPSTILLTVSSYPTISFSVDQRATASIAISPFIESSIQLFFSDTTLYACTVTCSITQATNSAIQLSQSSTTVAKGSYQTSINYKLTSTLVQLSSTFTIVCSAQSNGVTGVDQQYQSSIATATAVLTFQTPQIDMLDPTGQFKVSGSNFEVPLRLIPSPASNSNITVQCGLRRFDTLSSLTAFQNSITATSCPSTLTSTTTASDLSAYSYNGTKFDWYLIDPTNSSIQVSQLNIYLDGSLQSVTIERRPYISIKTPFYTYLSLFCCDAAVLTASTQATAYQNVKSQLIMSVPSNQDPTLVLPAAPTYDDLLNPSYDPCTCDLTVGLCDFKCCCDKDCTASDKTAFNFDCPIRHRLVFEKSIDRWSCYDMYNNPKLIEDDWFPILCIQFNFTYILGNFYSPNDLDALLNSNNNQFLALIQGLFSTSYNYLSSIDTTNQNTGNYPTCSLTAVSSYTNGQCLIEMDENGNNVDFLRFPLAKNSLSSCLYDSPIRFLTPQSRVFCQITVDATSCTSQTSQLDYHTYVNKILLANPSLSTDQLPINEVEYYKCPNFLASSISIQPTNAALSKCGYNFAVNTRLFDNQQDATACDGDTWTVPSDTDKTETQKIPNDYYQEAFILNNCVALTSATVQAITSQAGSCSNVLAGVRYVLIWKGGAVVKVLARVILTDVTYDAQTSSALLKQFYQIEWNYNSDLLSNVATVSGYDAVINQVSYYSQENSGTKGYLKGKPIISGYKSQTDTNIDTSYNLRISSQKLLNGELCGTIGLSERELIKFGYNTSSTCVVQLSRIDLTSTTGCTNLKRIVFEKLNSYYAPSNYVSKNGNPTTDQFNQAEWISVLPATRTYLNSPDASNLDFSLNTCKGVPYKITVWFFYQTVGKSNGDEIYEIVNSQVTYTLKDWTYSCNTEDCSSAANLPLQNFNLEFQAHFIKTNKPDLTWAQKCNADKYPGPSCLSEVFWMWPKDYSADDFFYLYQVNFGVIFGVFGFVIFYVMIIGFVCPC